MKKTIPFIIGCALLFISTAMMSSCHKTPRDCQGGTYYIDSYTRSLFFSADTGSYWVYQDSLGNIDSTWGAKDSVTFGGYTCAEGYMWNIYSNLIENNYQIIGQNNGATSTVSILSSVYGNGQPTMIAIANDIIDTFYNPLTSPTGYSATFYNSYQVNQYCFNNAVKINTSRGGVNGYYFVFVPNIGIVEKWNWYGGNGGPLKVIRYFISH